MNDKPTPTHDQALPPDDGKPQSKALHGERTEVNWDQGNGRQPYTNQGDEENGEPADTEFAVGDRGRLSGNNLDQLEEVKKKP